MISGVTAKLSRSTTVTFKSYTSSTNKSRNDIGNTAELQACFKARNYASVRIPVTCFPASCDGTIGPATQANLFFPIPLPARLPFSDQLLTRICTGLPNCAHQHTRPPTPPLHQLSSSCDIAHTHGALPNKLSFGPIRPTIVVATLSQPHQPSFDDLYEYYDPDSEPQLQARPQQLTPLSQRRPPSSSSGSAKSLRRTSRLEELNTSRRRPVFAASRPTVTVPHPPLPKSPQRPPQLPQERVSDPLFDNSSSTTPRSSRRVGSRESFWPRRTTRISRRTHDAILFALEAIRAGSGIDSKPLSPDTIEENARMSDLVSGTQATGGFRNGAARAAPGPVPVSTEPPRGVRTPTDVMRARRERDARKKAEQDAREREAAEQLQRQEERYIPEAAEDTPTQRRTRTRISTGESQAAQRTTGAQALSSGGRRPENIPPPAIAGSSRPRTSALDQEQPRPPVTQQPGLASDRGPSGGPTRRTRNGPLEPFNDPASQTPQGPPQPTQTSGSQPIPESSTTQPSRRSGFPQAFERWEALSSHWEGLTSYWVRRLQENSNELNDKPINQQTARHIADLSAAGANLFHAVVELQRLRASSERKFQRWFFETRQEQERAQEVQAELERLLRAEREERANALASVATAQTDRMKAEDLVKEMRRELQISKEEARRAWEELGRREQAERERTISLRSGEPTLVGGVQVVPMTQGVPSRQTSTANRPATRDGPYTGGPGPTPVGGQQGPRSTTTTTLDSPSDEQRQFTYDPQASSPTETDPFTESAQRSRQPQMQSPDLGQQASQQPQTQPPTTTDGPSSSLYQSARPGTTASHATDPSDQRSYIPSTASGDGSDFGEEEYEIDPDGSYRRDVQGRPIPYPTHSSGGRIQSDDGSDEYDVATDLERERQHRERYGNLGASGMRIPPGSVPPPVPSPQTLTQQLQGPSSQPARTPESQGFSPADYSGQGWGEVYDTVSPRHRHLTQLSDIQEERSTTSPSRASYASGGPGEQRASGGDVTGGFPSSRAPQAGR